MSEKLDTGDQSPAPLAAVPAVKTVVAKLRCLDLRGETVHTRWGNVAFDRDGLAELEVPEEELPMLSAIRPYSWLAEDHVPPTPTAPPKKVEPAKGKKSDPVKDDGKKPDLVDGKK